jgi:hypothetical protein
MVDAQMPDKRIVVLANSVKKSARCVAGREITLGNPVSIGAWLRPISDELEGELLPKHMKISGSQAVEPLMIVDVPVEAHAGDAVHPEDWRVTGATWSYVDAFPATRLPALVDKPDSLWFEKGNASDSVTPARLATIKNHQSLYLIRPEGLRVRCWREHNPFKGYPQKKTRAIFTYRGIKYDMSFTDPIATRLYCGVYPSTDNGAAPDEKALPFGDNCLICVSLTLLFKGNHYKVVATVLALP